MLTLRLEIPTTCPPLNLNLTMLEKLSR
ncbi:unnamed protein product, partial [Allacma fusca]